MAQFNYDADDSHLRNMESGHHPPYNWAEWPSTLVGVHMADDWSRQIPQDPTWIPAAEFTPNNAPTSGHKLLSGRPATVAQHLYTHPNLDGREYFQRPVMAQMATRKKRLRRPASYQSAPNLLNWDAHQDQITKLYIDDQNSLDETRRIMSSQFGFVASVKQYKDKFDEWGLGKYLPSSTAKWIVENERQRRFKGLPAASYRFSGQPLVLAEVERKARRAKSQGNQSHKTTFTSEPPRNLVCEEPEKATQLVLDADASTHQAVPAGSSLSWQPPMSYAIPSSATPAGRLGAPPLASPVSISSPSSEVLGGSNGASPLNQSNDSPPGLDDQLQKAKLLAASWNYEAEPLLVQVIEECCKWPERCAYQQLDAWCSLVELYFTTSNLVKLCPALERANTLCYSTIEGEPRKHLLLKLAIKLVGITSQVHEAPPANDLIIKIEKETAKLIDLDDWASVNILVALGIYYQDRGMWNRAEAHFEHALAISMRDHDLECGVIETLELALEKRKFTSTLRKADSRMRRHLRQCCCEEWIEDFFGDLS